jgi:acetylornithine deacetylase/succinyl-diaminopimelate desuccinylase-like protein
MTAEEIEANVRAFIAAARAEEPRLDAELELLSWTPPSEIAPAHPLVAALQDAAASVLGSAPPLGIFPGGTDAPFFSEVAGIPTVPAFGPGLLPRAHAPNECVATASIVDAARMYALAATRFLDV